jgi:maltooligosyltrehalose trehalohydrolase
MNGAVRFSVWAPKAKQLSVRIFSDASQYDRPLECREPGVWRGEVPGVGAGTLYKYLLDGRDFPDPVSRFQPRGVHGPSQVVAPDDFAWTDAGWTGIAMADHAIYELHVGTFTEAGTFDAVIERLPALRELGVTSIEIMPVAEFPGGRNWGYDGAYQYAPQSTYGGPEGLRRLVDAAHAEGLAVILDVVYNHFGPEGNYISEFGPYFTEVYKTPWGSAVNFDGAQSDEVRRFFVDNARYWVTEFHIDALRLDAIHGIFDFGAHHVLRAIEEAVREQAKRLGRRVQVIGESDLNDPTVVRPPERGGYGLDGQWSDDFHHAVHATLTGERTGYYADFDGGVPMIAKAMADRFIYDGRYSRHRKRTHGAPVTDVSAEHFVIALQNHDQVGNRAAGERLSTLIDFDRQKLAAALLLLSPYVPLLFMGEEYGETNPFQYFISHGDRELMDSVRTGRHKEFEAFGWGDDVPDPGAEETFLRSRLDWKRRCAPGHRELRALYTELLHLRRSEPALRPGASRIDVGHDAAAGWITLELAPGSGARVVTFFNISGETREIPSAGIDPERWHLRLSTAEARFGGAEPRTLVTSAEQHGHSVTLPPYSAALFREEAA